MGMAGGILIYVITNEILYRYESNLTIDKEVYDQGVELLLTYNGHILQEGKSVLGFLLSCENRPVILAIGSLSAMFCFIRFFYRIFGTP